LALGVAVITMIATIAWLANRPPSTSCGIFPDSGGPVILASKVVLRPWLGHHHAYGIFLVPDQYRDPEYSATLTVLGMTDPANLRQHLVSLSDGSVKVHGETITTEPGRYVVHEHIRTRVALWLLVTGHFGDLRATCNWALALTSRSG
jgi:hypothetical protein